MDDESIAGWAPGGPSDGSNAEEYLPTDNTDNTEGDLNLFKAIGVKYPEYWQCIRYIAPTDEQKKWTSREAIGVYCLACKTEIKYHPVKNNKGVKRHMEKYHLEMLGDYEVSC